jgi:hypothetical protein
LVPAPDGGDDFVGIGSPGEGFGVVVGFGEEAVDGGLQLDNRAEHAALEPPPRQLAEEAL